jgi:hypothetical protein
MTRGAAAAADGRPAFSAKLGPFGRGSGAAGEVSSARPFGRGRDDAPSGGIDMHLERLQGTWRAVWIEAGGGPIPAEIAATSR